VLRITTVREDEKNVRLRLCGQFTGEYVPELERALANEASIQSVALDLTNVTFVDREAMMFLCTARSRQIPIQNPPSYVRRWMKLESRCGPLPEDSPKPEADEE
jgi:ABC-type transporter Mla MlaB component